MLHQASAAATLIATTAAADSAARRRLETAGAELLVLPDLAGRVSLSELWKELGRRQVQTLLLEGGATLAAAALQSGLIDRMMVFVAPKLIGGTSDYGIFRGAGCARLVDAPALEDLRLQRFDDDILICGEVVRCLPD
jgi:diaminohydroxyphosphoribosylaminopyrimidine deaminase/5-amino-6-(5-phosphoribosylamino)uracil reductase